MEGDAVMDYWAAGVYYAVAVALAAASALCWGIVLRRLVRR